MTENLCFKAKTRIVARCLVVTIPKAFSNAELIKEGQEYIFQVKEVKNGSNA